MRNRKIIYVGVILIGLCLSFILGYFYGKADNKSGNTPGLLRQQVSKDISATPSPIKDQRIHLWKEGFEISPNGLYKVETYMGNYADPYHYFQIFVTDLRNEKMWRVYSGDFHTMDAEWTSDNKIKVSYDCGTGCKSIRIIEVNEYVSLEFDKSGKWITETF